MNEDVQNELLDAEFRQILYIIKPYITNINDHYQLERYRIWLERLSAAHSSEKRERNKYLLELANQIHDNSLKPPFTYLPPKGFLPQLRTRRNALDQGPAQISKHFFKEEQEEWPNVTPRRSHQIDQNVKRHVRPKDNSPHKRKQVKAKVVRPFQKLGNTESLDRGQSENSSWCDMTESTTSANHACGDTDLDDDGKKVLSTQHKQDGLKIQEHFMRKYEEENKSKTSSREGSSFNVQQFLNTEDQPNRKPTQQELEALKMRMKDLLEVKNALRDTHCLTEDRKKTIETLQSKLFTLEQQKSELQMLLEAQKKKFLELDQLKTKELDEFKEKFTQLRQREIEFLKQHHNNERTTLEKTYSAQISDLQSKIDLLKHDYEDKIRKITDSNMSLMKQKESEIQQLQSQLKCKDSQPTNEANGEQIINLKRCISKLDKVFHKNEKDYVKKIEKLRQELEVKDMTSQVQLQTQRADLIARNTAAKQEELKNALNSLEGKYKKMMETLQMHALETKRHDDRVIDELKTLLEKNKIVY